MSNAVSEGIGLVINFFSFKKSTLSYFDGVLTGAILWTTKQNQKSLVLSKRLLKHQSNSSTHTITIGFPEEKVD